MLLWSGAAAVWAVWGTSGLLLGLAAAVVALLVVVALLLVRVERLRRAVAAVSSDLETTVKSIAAWTERQARFAEALEAVETSEGSEALHAAVDNLYTQIEGLLNLHSTLKPQRPLPPLRDWAVSPDFMTRAVTIVLDRRPATILECGSGTSTVYLALALRRIGRGSIVALEHKERFAEATRSLLAEHGLADIATVHHAPLRPVTIDGREWLWYDLAALEEVDSCELLVVDGPPRTVQKLARYPALPLLRDRLAPGAIVLMDDYRRDSERRTVRRWRKETPDLTLRVHEHEKQTAEIELPA